MHCLQQYHCCVTERALQCVLERRTVEMLTCGGCTSRLDSPLVPWAGLAVLSVWWQNSPHTSLSSVGREPLWLKPLWPSTAQTFGDTKGKWLMCDTIKLKFLASSHKTDVSTLTDVSRDLFILPVLALKTTSSY